MNILFWKKSKSQETYEMYKFRICNSINNFLAFMKENGLYNEPPCEPIVEISELQSEEQEVPEVHDPPLKITGVPDHELPSMEGITLSAPAGEMFRTDIGYYNEYGQPVYGYTEEQLSSLVVNNQFGLILRMAGFFNDPNQSDIAEKDFPEYLAQYVSQYPNLPLEVKQRFMDLVLMARNNATSTVKQTTKKPVTKTVKRVVTKVDNS